jgi:hypothetical protein
MKFISYTRSLALVLGILLAIASTAFAQNRAIKYGHPFESAEELIYVGEFSRLLLKKVDVADFRFTASRENLAPVDSAQPTGFYSLKLTGDITSRGFFSKLFNLRFHERIEATVEPGKFAVQRAKRIDEQGKRLRESEVTFDQRNGKLVWVERDPNNPAAGIKSITATFSGQVFDILSAIYYLRTQPLEVGKNLELTVSDSGRVYRVPVKVVEKKRMKTVLGRVEVVRVDPDLYGPQGMVREGGQMSIWLTNDSKRIPVSARIKTDVGTFDITLRKIGNRLDRPA